MPRRSRIRTSLAGGNSNPLDQLRRDMRLGLVKNGSEARVVGDGIITQGNVSFNTKFAGSEIDQQQRAAATQADQAAAFDQASQGQQAISALQAQLLNQPAQTGEGAVQDINRQIDGGPATPVGQASGGMGLTVENPFTSSADPRLADKGGQQFTDQMQRQTQALTSKAASEYAAMGELLGKGVPPWRLRQAQQEFQRKYPNFGQQLRPLSSEQAAEIKRTLQLREAQQQADTFAQQAGVPSLPLTLDEKGRPAPIPGYSEHIKSQGELRRAEEQARLQQAKQREKMFSNSVEGRRRQVDEINKALDNPFDPISQSKEWGQIEQQRLDRINEFNRFELDQRKRFFPEEFENQPAQVRTVSRQQIAEARNIASSNGIDPGHVAVDEDDVAELQAIANRTGKPVRVVDATTNRIGTIQPQ